MCQGFPSSNVLCKVQGVRSALIDIVK